MFMGLRDNSGQDGLNGLEVMTCNIGNFKGHQSLAREKVVDYLKLCGVPNVLFLQEVGSEKEAKYYSNELGLKYLSGTYKRLNFPVAPRIDFLFLSSNLYCRQAAVLPMSPGDHFPVRANIEI